MSQQTLNNLLILHIHKSEIDSMDLKGIANEFASVKEPRLRMFRKLQWLICISLLLGN